MEVREDQVDPPLTSWAAVRENTGPQLAQPAATVTLKLIGSLDTATAPELERQLPSVLAGGVKDIVFDLAQLKFISSAGLRVVMIGAKQARAAGARLVVAALTPTVREIFEISRFHHVVEIFPTVRDALLALSGAAAAAFDAAAAPRS